MEKALITLAIYALPIFLTLTMSVALQAWVANRLGDPTPKMQGRLSWDPVRHMDLLGTVVLPALFLLLAGGGAGIGLLIGWAKPLEFDVRRYTSRAALFMVELPVIVGPLLMAALWLVLVQVLSWVGIRENFIDQVGTAGYGVGLSFFAIAMLPFPPLPLGNLILRNLPAKYLFKVLPILQYSSFIIIGLLLLGVLTPYLRGVMGFGAIIVKGLTFWL